LKLYIIFNKQKRQLDFSLLFLLKKIHNIISA
jgi:hypothetical protein